MVVVPSTRMRGMATCPSCGVHGYETDGTFTLDEVLWCKPLGTFSLAGAQLKTSAVARPRLRCNRCGWSILGVVGEREFIGDPATQRWPGGSSAGEPR